MYTEKGSVPFDFDKSYMRRVSKEKFLKAHKHLENLVDLPAIWDEHNPKASVRAEAPKPAP